MELLARAKVNKNMKLLLGRDKNFASLETTLEFQKCIPYSFYTIHCVYFHKIDKYKLNFYI